MYKKQQRIQSSETALSNYIDGVDAYNSYFLQRLSDQSFYREDYQITVYEFRPDLIAKDFYGSSDYMGILLAQTKLSLVDFRRGVVLSLLPKSTIDRIISEM